MYCPKCGVANSDQASFCYQCGANLKTSEQEPGQIAQGVPLVAAYAGFWKRLAAYIIDYFIVSAVTSVINFIFYGVLSFATYETIIFTAWILSPILLAGSWLYFALMESSTKQATLGKMALGIIVTDTGGRRITFGRATGRYFSKILSYIIFLIGYIMIAFTEKKQGLHDILANTLVVNK